MPAPHDSFTYTPSERLPIEVLVFRVDPAHVDEFLEVDHEVWTLGEALLPVLTASHFDQKRCGLTTQAWRNHAHLRVGILEDWNVLQHYIQTAHKQNLIAVFHTLSNSSLRRTKKVTIGIHRVSRFERID